jgi:hypothetical protein
MFSWKKVAAVVGVSAVLLTATAVEAIPVTVLSGGAPATHKVSTTHRVISGKHKAAPVSKKTSKTVSAKHKTVASHRHIVTTTRRKGTVASHIAKPATHLTTGKTAARPVVSTHAKM